MPRERLRPDWPITAYKFWASPVGELPKALWDQAHAMRRLWNQLVLLRLKCVEETSRLWDEDPVIAEAARLRAETPPDAEAPKRRPKLQATEQTRAAIKERWAALEGEVLTHVRSEETKAVLDWEAREEVLERYRRATKLITQRQKEWASLPPGVKATRRKPELRTQGPLTNVTVPFRFTGGGMSRDEFLEKWNSSRPNSKIRLRHPGEEAFADRRWQTRYKTTTRAYVRVGSGDNVEQVPFTVKMHRDLPPESIVKTASLNGYLHPTRGWQWSIQVTVEYPPPPQGTASEVVAALDLGWRRIGDYIRVGVAHDSSGQTLELRLPLVDTGNQDTRDRRKAGRDYGENIFDVWRFKASADEALEAAKEEIRSAAAELDNLDEGWLSAIPEEAASVIRNLTRVRNSGLKRLAHSLDQSDRWTSAASGHLAEPLRRVRQTIEQWRGRDHDFRRRANDAYDRLTRRRDNAYYNLAHLLCDRYGRIVWEETLDLGRMASNPETHTDPALKESGKFRQYAAPARFRQILSLTTQKRGVELVGGETAYSTLKCHVCGQINEPTARLTVVCDSCGTSEDQDVRAAKNLLAAAVGSDYDLATTAGHPIPLDIGNRPDLKQHVATLNPG